MKDCCKHSEKDKNCYRKSDKKTFKLPRKFSKKKCKKQRGFTMRSSCAPYKDCLKGGGYKKLTSLGPEWAKVASNDLKKRITKLSYFSGGCFWGLQEGMNKINGVTKTTVGYMGGKKLNPTYEIVSFGKTDYAETVKVEYESDKITYKNLLDIFLTLHDPTSLNKQGADVGKQYRSIAFYSNDIEKQILDNTISELSKKINIVTEKLDSRNFKFYKAEDYHQEYFKKKHKTGGNKQFLFNPNNPKKSFDVYIDKDPSDTIPIKYKTINDVKDTIKKLEKYYKSNKYSHKRIWQVGMIMKVRLEHLKNKKKTHYKIAKRYLKFLGKRTKIKDNKKRKKLTFI